MQSQGLILAHVCLKTTRRVWARGCLACVSCPGHVLAGTVCEVLGACGAHTLPPLPIAGQPSVLYYATQVGDASPLDALVVFRLPRSLGFPT